MAGSGHGFHLSDAVGVDVLDPPPAPEPVFCRRVPHRARPSSSCWPNRRTVIICHYLPSSTLPPCLRSPLRGCPQNPAQERRETFTRGTAWALAAYRRKAGAAGGGGRARSSPARCRLAARLGAVGPGTRHRLSSALMALITSDCIF